MCTAAVEAEVTEVTSCQVYEWLREVCSTTLIQTSIILGGSGVIVQIDESQFRHKPKVYTRGITYICTYINVSTAPSWAGATTGCLGVWNGGHVAHTSLGVHGNGSLEECGYIASDNSKPCSPRDDHPLGSVAGVQPGGTTSSRLHSSHSEPFPPLRRPGNWRPHPTCGIVLESCEGEAETHEGLSPPPVAGVPRRVYVEGETWEDRKRDVLLHPARYCSAVPSLILTHPHSLTYTSLPPFLDIVTHTFITLIYPTFCVSVYLFVTCNSPQCTFMFVCVCCVCLCVCIRFLCVWCVVLCVCVWCVFVSVCLCVVCVCKCMFVCGVCL